MATRGGAIINIAGTTPVDDPEYRYKMPAVFGKIEGRGNGIKTVIPNIDDVALSLHRNPAEVNKFFGCELGAQTSYALDTSRAVVNGAHTDATLQSLMHRYIENFVVCPNCRLPETEYKIKGDCIYHRCAACGSKEMLDMNHKLTTFILAQDKKAKKAAKSKGKKGKKEEKLREKKKDSDEEDKKVKKDKKKKDKKKDKKKEKKAKEAKEEEGDTEGKSYLEDAIFGKNESTFAGDDDQLSVESEAGVDDEGALKLAVSGTKEWIEGNPNGSPDEIAEVVTNQQMASALKSHDKIQIFVKAVFTAQSIKNQDVEKYSEAIVKITNQKSIMERHLIAALEVLCMEKPKTFVVFLKQLYDNDALNENTILEWAEEGRNDFTLQALDEGKRSLLRGEAEPLVVWLQEDSESESEEEEE
mmetsp:Transcript_10331/g.15876  ORF Transcript_10331/g.15876 Transcript_10331/m.15876 type:complete len:415 (+) Transcript_10331:135-1379(+)|eukprot:CAMPEP_0178916242 /NCGR_PEP_ID=MMETSP0786-20121207/12508_1 /TAXON_ID=186022 /ORGANISM="Thalassionema frauenfeldii, Strain CCMP 1798" /LENGTH=414 /DNA_ID=CAMNT_0020589511 /DNA_START=118 /DNA_END=1362 /DNA_ORIENTATION=-